MATEDIKKLKKELAWYKAYCDQVQSSNHRAHEYACEHADEATGVIEYPYSEGDDYWTVVELDVHLEYEDNTGCFRIISSNSERNREKCDKAGPRKLFRYSLA